MLKGVTFKMKKTFLIVCLVMMIVSVISVVSFAEDITLRFAWYGAQTRTDRTLKVIKLFEEKYPNVKIIPEFKSWGEYWKILAIQGAGNNLPDLMQQSQQYLSLYGEKDLLLNLDPYVKDNRLDYTYAGSESEATISSGRRNNKLIGACVATDTDAAYIYDPELFKKAGVEEPTPDWTWEDYTEKAKKIHAALGIYADDTYTMGAEGLTLEFYLNQHGKHLYDESGKKLGYEDDSLFVDFYTRLADLVKEGVNSPPEVSSEVFGVNENQLIVNKKSAMLGFSSCQVVLLTAAAGRPLSLMISPNAKDQVQYGTTIAPALYLSVAKNSKYPEWAVKFIDFFMNDLEANKILSVERGVPISSKIREGIRPYLSDAEKVLFDYIDVAVKHSSSYETIFPTGHAEVRALLKTIYEKILYGELTPEKAAKEFREKANNILQKI